MAKRGRPTNEIEIANNQLLTQIFFEDVTKNLITVKLKSGHYSIKDVLIKKAMDGFWPAVDFIAKRIYPDRLPEDKTGNVQPVGYIYSKDIIKDKPNEVSKKDGNSESESPKTEEPIGEINGEPLKPVNAPNEQVSS
jgi:hypothetical protein